MKEVVKAKNQFHLTQVLYVSYANVAIFNIQKPMCIIIVSSEYGYIKKPLGT